MVDVEKLDRTSIGKCPNDGRLERQTSQPKGLPRVLRSAGLHEVCSGKGRLSPATSPPLKLPRPRSIGCGHGTCPNRGCHRLARTVSRTPSRPWWRATRTPRTSHRHKDHPRCGQGNDWKLAIAHSGTSLLSEIISEIGTERAPTTVRCKRAPPSYRGLRRPTSTRAWQQF